MSNIGKKPITIADGVTVTIQDGMVAVVGPKGNLDVKIPRGIAVSNEENKVVVKKEHNSPTLEPYFGLTRALIANMVTGVSKGFEKKLELSGVGYRAKMEGNDLVLNVGFAVPVRISSPADVKIAVEENVITVSGINKQRVGDVARTIWEVRPPDPYKAKGVKYVGEYIRRKAGKAAKAAGAK